MPVAILLAEVLVVVVEVDFIDVHYLRDSSDLNGFSVFVLKERKSSLLIV